MVLQILQQICNVIILIGGVFGAFVAVSTFLGKPLKFIKKRRDAAEKARRDEIAKDVEKRLTPRFDELYQQNIEQEEIIGILEKSSRDILRKEIINIYHINKPIRQLTETTKEYLDDLYQDYKAEHGNHYIDKIYGRMCSWEIVPDED